MATGGRDTLRRYGEVTHTVRHSASWFIAKTEINEFSVREIAKKLMRTTSGKFYTNSVRRIGGIIAKRLSGKFKFNGTGLAIELLLGMQIFLE